MKIQTSHNVRTSFGTRYPWLRRNTSAIGIGAVSFFLLVALLAGGPLLRRSGLMPKIAGLDMTSVAYNYLSSFAAEPERLTIDIKHKHFVKLEASRQEALRRGQITSDLKSYVPAVIRHRNDEIKVKLRLKGEWLDHVRTSKWSFRVKTRRDDVLFGMKRFDLQHPGTRSFIYEWLYRRALRREDIVAPRYEFVSVTINGKDTGVFAFDEGLAKQLIEHNERREGVILRFNADYRYKPFDSYPGTKTIVNNAGLTGEHSSEIHTYGEQKLFEKPHLRDQFLKAHNLMQAFRDAKLPAHEVFDVGAMANYMAVSELFGTLATADDWSDIRFLYDPIRSRLEPIGLEGASYQPLQHLLGAKYRTREGVSNRFHSLLFADEIFFTQYIRALERVSSPDYVSQLLDVVESDLKEALRTLYNEWPHKTLDTGLLFGNAESIRDYLDPSKGVHAYLRGCSTRTCELDLSSTQAMPIEVLSLTSGDAKWVSTERIVLPGKPWYGRMKFQTAEFTSPADAPSGDAPPGDLTLHYRLLATTKARQARVFPWPRFDESLFAADFLRRPPNARRFEFVDIDEARRRITLRPGDWTLAEDLILPAGYTVQAGPGVRLDLVHSAKILSRSPLQLRGTEQDPILIESKDGTGQGLLVLDAGGRSRLEHVVFRKLAPPTERDWALTGAATFYRSDVDFDGCEFLDNDAEDALNIVRSEFSIEHGIFSGVSSDALDSDFSDGQIAKTSFDRIEGDAIDLSGSEVEINQVRINGVRDKALSFGEGSHVNAENVKITDASIGVAAKDRSEVSIDDLSISDARYGIVVFSKKPEYGPATATVSGVAMVGVKEKALVETGSTLKLNGKAIAGSRDGVAEILYAE